MIIHRGVELRYDCRRESLPAMLRERFVRLDADADTRRWIDAAMDAPQSRAVTALRDAARQVVSLYDANGLFGAYSMRVLGTEQWRGVLGRLDDVPQGRLLDVGAGDGEVTAAAAPLFAEVVTTELSSAMARRLEKQGYRCHEVDLASEGLPDGEGRFDVAALLNVLDRTPRPFTLLERLPTWLAPGALVVVAVPLPVRPGVYLSTGCVPPEERLPGNERAWEEAVASLHRWVFEPLGYKVKSLSRVPYLCRGDARQPVATLDDAVFVLRPPSR